MRAKAVKLYRRGVEVQAIADKLNVSFATIFNWLAREGVAPDRRGRVDRNLFEWMWRSGSTTEEMARAFRIKYESVSTIGRRMGLPSRHKVVTAAAKAAMVEEYKAGASARAVAKAHRVHWVLVFRAVAKAGATRRIRTVPPANHPWRQTWKGAAE